MKDIDVMPQLQCQFIKILSEGSYREKKLCDYPLKYSKMPKKNATKL